MKITPEIINDELIGTTGNVEESRHSDYIGISGQIVNESKNTLTFSKFGKEKKVVKEAAIFRFQLSDGTIVEIDGKLLVGRPEDRLKKNIKRLW